MVGWEWWEANSEYMSRSHLSWDREFVRYVCVKVDDKR